MSTIYYLFDPLCGWCYGAAPGVSILENILDMNIELMPTGLFSGVSSRQMTPEFAVYAWGNDLRISELTNQVFSERYQTSVLGDFQQRFDSGPATLALTAVFATEPEKEMAALKVIQRARYVDGKDVTNNDVLAKLLIDLELDQAAIVFRQARSTLHQINSDRLAKANQLMQHFNIHGVPNFIAVNADRYKLLNARAIYKTPLVLVDEAAAI